MIEINDFISQMDSKEAIQEIENMDIDDAQKELFQKTITRFPDCQYLKRKQFLQELPAWLKKQFLNFYFFAPHAQAISIRFDRHLNTAFNDRGLPFYSWYHFGQGMGEFSKVNCNGRPLLFLAFGYEQVESVLAVYADEQSDQKIYDLSYENIKSADQETGYGEIETGHLYAVFSNYAELLSSVFSVHYIIESIDGKSVQELGDIEFMKLEMAGAKVNRQEVVFTATT